MRKLNECVRAVLSLSIILTIGLAFAGLTVVAFIIWTIVDELIPAYPGTGDAANASWNETYANASASIGNVTGGFDSAVNLLLVAITIFILALSISALLMLRQK